MYDRRHGDRPAPRWARPHGQEGRCRCSRGLYPHVTTHQALAAPPSARQVRTEGAWLTPLPAVLAVCQCEQHLHTTGRGGAPGQSAPSPVSVGLCVCNTEWTRAVRQVSLEFLCCFSDAKKKQHFCGVHMAGGRAHTHTHTHHTHLHTHTFLVTRPVSSLTSLCRPCSL